MVVCSTPVVSIAQLPPSTVPYYATYPCQLASTPRYPPTPLMPPARISLISPISYPSMLQRSPPNTQNSNDSPPDGSVVPCNVVNSNNLVTPVPYIPYNAGWSNALHPNIASSPISTAAGYTCTTVVPTQSSVVQCTPGVCAPPPPSGPLEMYSMSPGPPTIIPVTLSPPLPLPTNLCTATPATSWKQSYGMEQVWQSEFRSLFSQYMPHTWMLVPVVQKPVGIWNTNVDSAKVRFCCEDCGHGWTSMKGRVAFWFLSNMAGAGVVCVKLYGQQCDRCKTGNYEPAMWYPEEVIKVLVNIYNRVGEAYYGFAQAPYHRARRAGKPRTPHNSELCQACKDGVCAERR